MDGQAACDIENDGPEEQDEANAALFNQKYPKLANIDKVDILAILETCHQRGSLYINDMVQSLEHAVVEVLYPELVATLEQIYHKFDHISHISVNSEFLLPTRAANENVNRQHSIFALFPAKLIEWRYGLPDSWNRWLDRTADRNVLKRAFADIRRLFSEIGGLYKTATEWAKDIQQATTHGRVNCIAAIVDQLRTTLEVFPQALRNCELKVTEMDKKAEERDNSLAPSQGIHKANSFSTSVDLSGGTSHRGKIPENGLARSAHFDQIVDATFERRNLGWSKFQAWCERHWRNMHIWHQRLDYDAHWLALVIQLVFNPVVWILLAALPFTVIATILCAQPDDVPVIDSNFHSTLSQTIAGLAGLAAIIAGLRRDQKPSRRNRGRPKKEWRIEAKFKKTFISLLVVSVLSGLCSTIIYPWQSPISIPLGFLSNVAQNVATLLIVQESAQQISELEYTIAMQP